MPRLASDGVGGRPAGASHASSLSFSLRGGDEGTCGRSELSRLDKVISAHVPLFLLHLVILPQDVALRVVVLNVLRATMLLVQVGPRARRFATNIRTNDVLVVAALPDPGHGDTSCMEDGGDQPKEEGVFLVLGRAQGTALR